MWSPPESGDMSGDEEPEEVGLDLHPMEGSDKAGDGDNSDIELQDFSFDL